MVIRFMALEAVYSSRLILISMVFYYEYEYIMW